MKRSFCAGYCIALSFAAIAIMAARPVKDRSLQLTIFFDHFIGKDTLHLNSPMTTILGDTVMIERFRYYVSNFSVSVAGKTIALPADYFLIDEADASSKKIQLSIPEMAIDSLHFLLGVDSIRNISGVQTGALDPANGMFWTWNSGYVMAKLEGTCESIAAAGNRFTYHVGGFRTGMNAARMIHLAIGSKQKIKQLHIGADINRWFKGTTLLDIKATPVCHSPGALAVRIANNYTHQFTVNAAE